MSSSKVLVNDFQRRLFLSLILDLCNTLNTKMKNIKLFLKRSLNKIISIEADYLETVDFHGK